MPDIRLVALDLDGTVFNDEKEITPRTLEAIRAAIAKGVDVIPATGRVASGLPEAFFVSSKFGRFRHNHCFIFFLIERLTIFKRYKYKELCYETYKNISAGSPY